MLKSVQRYKMALIALIDFTAARNRRSRRVTASCPVRNRRSRRVTEQRSLRIDDFLFFQTGFGFLGDFSQVISN